MIPVFLSRFKPPDFPDANTYHAIRNGQRLTLPGESLGNWLWIVAIEIGIGIAMLICLVTFIICQGSDAEWASLAGIVSALAGSALVITAVATALGFLSHTLFGRGYFKKRLLHAQRSVEYQQFRAEFGPLHNRAVDGDLMWVL